MLNTKVLIYIGFVVVAFRATVDAVCGQCSATNYAACINETAFTVCYDGITLSQQIGVCPDNEVCTNQQGVCKSRDDPNVKTDCGVCNVCTNGFSCKSKTQFEYCSGTKLTGIIGKCPELHYCSIENLVASHSICGTACSRKPTCYAAEFVPTPAPEPDYTEICVGKLDKGYYDDIYDSTCTKYVYCELLQGAMNAVLFTCSSGYFSPIEKKCVTTKPSRCA